MNKTNVQSPLVSLQIINRTLGKTHWYGAIFQIYNQFGECHGTYITDADGIINITDIEPGWYVIREATPGNSALINVGRPFEVKEKGLTVIKCYW